ncbi:unnamed protein product [Acanthoscelides obtectus]|uniref:Uncharacterized protein n=1 Tax=Acanthoscelides obtectus TaxID=200917 RepID=A0A9P0K0X8_ACAOB|nr:unnamed protein product [Acanthoscelides obtectus]CAK1666070.1 hypothetical protein AOBTE_LOCUS25143 [Acanthoscelides obtectus]
MFALAVDRRKTLKAHLAWRRATFQQASGNTAVPLTLKFANEPAVLQEEEREESKKRKTGLGRRELRRRDAAVLSDLPSKFLVY